MSTTTQHHYCNLGCMKHYSIHRNQQVHVVDQKHCKSVWKLPTYIYFSYFSFFLCLLISAYQVLLQAEVHSENELETKYIKLSPVMPGGNLISQQLCLSMYLSISTFTYYLCHYFQEKSNLNTRTAELSQMYLRSGGMHRGKLKTKQNKKKDLTGIWCTWKTKRTGHFTAGIRNGSYSWRSNNENNE